MRLILPALCILVLSWSESALAQSCDDLRFGLVSSWTGDENGDDDAGDHHGELNGTLAHVPGMVGGAFRFDGEDDYIEVPSSPDFDLGMDDFTIHTWLNLAEVDSNKVYPIIMRGLCIARDFSYADWLLCLHGGRIGFTRFDGMEMSVFAPWVPRPNTWYHLAVVRSGDDLLFYVDGQQRGGATNIAGAYYGPGPVADMDVNIGREQGGDLCEKQDRWWNGELDEIKLLHRGLTALEIEAIYNLRGECKDTDGDGILDGEDLCADSDLSTTVVIDGVDTGVENIHAHDGCTLADVIEDVLASNPEHSAVVLELVELAKSGAISGQELAVLVTTIETNGDNTDTDTDTDDNNTDVGDNTDPDDNDTDVGDDDTDIDDTDTDDDTDVDDTNTDDNDTDVDDNDTDVDDTDTDVDDTDVDDTDTDVDDDNDTDVDDDDPADTDTDADNTGPKHWCKGKKHHKHHRHCKKGRKHHCKKHKKHGRKGKKHHCKKGKKRCK